MFKTDFNMQRCYCESKNERHFSSSSRTSVSRSSTWNASRFEREKQRGITLATGRAQSISLKVLAFKEGDYILIDVNKKHCLTNARSYGGTETHSDHKLVVAKIQADWMSLYLKINKKKKEERAKKVDVRRLILDEEARKQYAEKLEETTQDNSLLINETMIYKSASTKELLD